MDADTHTSGYHDNALFRHPDIEELRDPKMGEFDYMKFMVPGLIMMSVITNSYSNVVSSFYGSKFQRNIEELLVSPTPNIVILLGYVVGGMTRGLGIGVIVTLLSLYFADFSIHNVPVTISIVLLTSMLFSLGGF